MKKTTALVFDHRGRTKEGRKGPIEIRITSGRRSYYFATGIKVHRSEFVAGRIVNCAGADKLNERVAVVYDKVMSLVNDSIRQGEPIDAEYVRRQVWQTAEKVADGDTLLRWIHEQIPLLDVSEGTRKHYYPLEDRLREFGRIRRWEDATTENIYQFDAWLHGLRKPVNEAALKAGVMPERLSDAGIYNYHKTLKALLNRADRMGKIERNPYERLRGVFKRGDRENPEYLTEDEMTRIRKLELPYGSVLDISRDLFVFQMFTGLAYSDALAFDFSIYKKVGGTWQAVGRRKKTGETYISELLPPVVAVLEKYGWRVPQVGNADYNHRLKEIGRMADIRTPLHSHLARHTFATWMLSKEVRIESVRQMLGHKNIVTTQRYAKVLAQSVHDDYERVKAGL